MALLCLCPAVNRFSWQAQAQVGACVVLLVLASGRWWRPVLPTGFDAGMLGGGLFSVLAACSGCAAVCHTHFLLLCVYLVSVYV